MQQNPGQKEFLNSGKQTKITPTVKKLANELKNSNPYEFIFNFFAWKREGLKLIKGIKAKIKLLRKRTADEIIKSGEVTGCGDIAIVFASVARANGIPARVVETLEENWLKEGNTKYISGHVFVDVDINGRWLMIDPTLGNINSNYVWGNDRRFIVYKKGLDSWDIGIKDFTTLKKAARELRKKTQNEKQTKN